jgi:hypothetical protein
MQLYIPFIHETLKKDEQKFEQISLQIEEPIIPIKKDNDKMDNSIIVIELF